MAYVCHDCGRDMTAEVEQAIAERRWGMRSVLTAGKAEDAGGDAVIVQCPKGHYNRFHVS
jgi:hypothetical protein